MNRGLGWRPDPPDKRDFLASERLGSGAVPALSRNRHLIVEVLDQGTASSCVANACGQAVRAAQVRALPAGSPRPPLGSRLWGYWMSRRIHHEDTIDGGTFLRTFFAAMVRFGFPPEADYPYRLEKVNDRPPTSLFAKAFDQRQPTVYRRIFETGAARVDAIKRALAAGFLVAFGTEVAVASIEAQAADGVTISPPFGEQTGGHAMVAVEHDGDRFAILNSWGRAFGVDGYCTFSADYLAWEATRDLWIVEQVPAWPGRAP